VSNPSLCRGLRKLDGTFECDWLQCPVGMDDDHLDYCMLRLDDDNPRVRSEVPEVTLSDGWLHRDIARAQARIATDFNDIPPWTCLGCGKEWPDPPPEAPLLCPDCGEPADYDPE
jgi:hypothetical protein